MTFHNIHVIINPAAGQPRPILRAINRVFYEQDIDWCVTITRGDGTGRDLAQAAVEADADLVVVYGGDGTVKDVINGLIETDVPLAILQGGTGNALAYELGIPPDLEDATRLIVGQHQRKGLDVGQVECDGERAYFVLRASIGLQTALLETATPEMKAQLGNLAYVVAAIQTLSDPTIQRYELVIDGETVTGEGISCLIANSAMVGGRASFRFHGDVDPADGLLDVFLLDTSFESIVSMVGQQLNVETPPVRQHWRGRQIEVHGDDAQNVTLDGEAFGATPIHVSVVTDAVEVVVPA